MAEHGSQECIFSADELTIASAVDPKLKIEFESLSFTRAIVFLIVFAFLSFAGTVCCADPSLPVTFNNVRDGFSISFPSGWGPMAAAKLETANKTAAIEHPDWKRPAFHYGYEMTNSAGAAAVTFDNANTGGLAFAPYMAIRITETARPPDPKAIQDELEKGGEIPRDIHISRQKPEFDQEFNVVVQKNRVEVAGAPSVGVFVAYFLTKESVIKMFFYTPLADNGDPSIPIPEIIKSVRVTAEKKFEPAAARSRTGLILAILSMVVIVMVLARAKPGKVNS